MLVIPDLHCPWEHSKALDHCRRVYDLFKCDTVICLGDEADLHGFSLKYRQHPDLPGPKDELDMAIESLESFYDAFPEVELLESNHSTRLIKKAIGNGLPTMVLKSWMELIRAPAGWRYHEIQFELDGVLYIHGEGFSSNSWKNAFNKMKGNVVMGHLHSNPGVCFSQSRKSRFFVMNTGCLIDPKAKAFDYARFSHERAGLGCGVVIDGEECYFIPMREKDQ